jgi:predicted acyl esterase
VRRAHWAVISTIITLALPLVAVGGPAAAAGTAASTAPASVDIAVRPSVHQVAVLHAPPGATATLLRDSQALQAKMVDELGSVMFRNVRSGAGYRVRVTGSGVDTERGPVTVLKARTVPPQSLYSGQQLEVGNLSPTSGYGYLTTRDGTTLSVQVVLPGPPDQGPYPAVLEYSGYDPSSPSTGQPQYQLMLPPSGYAWIGVNIRGTGCSGGAFNFFENLQALDGYDAIETIAAQPWSNGHVGMAGISYAGISQLFVARTQPPHLDAITPMSVIDDTWRGILYPGGILNNGFALKFANERLQQNKWPNPDAPAWVKQRIANGDATCADNMLLRGQNVDLVEVLRRHPNPSPDTVLEPEFAYDFPNGSDSLAPAAFVRKIRAKVFIAGTWQDEQTGGHWPNMLDKFSPAALTRAELQNGVHTEALDPQVVFDTFEFLDLHLGRRTPTIAPAVRQFAPALWGAITGIDGLTLPPDRFTGKTYDQALAAYSAEPKIKVLWETGNVDGEPAGTLLPRAQTRYSSWPIPETRATTWYLRGEGALRVQPPTKVKGRDGYRPDPSLRPRVSFPGGNIWGATPAYDWKPVVDGASVAYLSKPLTRTTTMAGTGSVDLWISSTATDNDVQATLTEVRPDGTERYVQNGWLRLSHRKLDPTRSTPLNPYHSDVAEDMEPLTPGAYTYARIALFPFAHQFRAGSQIRLTIEAPGGDRPEWAFETPATNGQVLNHVARNSAHRSRLVLPVLPSGPDLGPTAAPCPSLRAQPCRAFVAPSAP